MQNIAKWFGISGAVTIMLVYMYVCYVVADGIINKRPGFSNRMVDNTVTLGVVLLPVAIICLMAALWTGRNALAGGLVQLALGFGGLLIFGQFTPRGLAVAGYDVLMAIAFVLLIIGGFVGIIGRNAKLGEVE